VVAAPSEIAHRSIVTKEAIKQQLEANPFRPFTLRLTDGRTCEVPARDFVSLSPSGRTLVVYTLDGDGVRLLDVGLITEIETKAA
jgi:hypothetical protein